MNAKDCRLPSQDDVRSIAILEVPSSIEQLQRQLESARKLIEASRLILASAGEGIYGLDLAGNTTFANPAAEAMTGWVADDLIGKSQHALIHHSHADGEYYPREHCPIYMALCDGRVHTSESDVFWRKDGTCFPVVYTSTPILRDGATVGAVVLFRDISESKRREQWEQSRASIFLSITGHRQLEETLGLIADAFTALYPTRAIAFLLRSGSQLHLAAHAALPPELQRLYSTQSVGDHGSACAMAAESGQEILAESTSQLPSQYIEVAATDFPRCLALPLLSASGEVLGAVAVLARQGDSFQGPFREPVNSACDIARLAIEHQRLHTELVRQSQHDHLTGLPNRLLLEDRLKQALMHSKRHGTQVGVCYVDLDRFKQINDTLGHSVGDIFLKRIAHLLTGNVREIDTVARHGGDEFILVLPDLDSAGEAEEVCARLLVEVRKPVHIGGHILTPTISVGISMYPSDGDTPSLLLQHADSALYAAKRAGRDRAQAFDPEIGRKLQRNAELQTALHQALDEKQFNLLYQPLYNTHKHLIGFEALLRWVHPELGPIGPIGPDQFIPLAEESGMIIPIGEWVLNEACRQSREWQSELAAHTKIFVNISGVQLNRPDFTATIDRALAQSGLAPRLLELEITESWIIADPVLASAQLRKLRELGVCISIDDFGTGHSSLSALHELSVDTIKIDRSFIARLDGSARNSATIRTIVALAQQLGLQTVAEGVETELQCIELQEMQCGMMQGFFLARPLAPGAARLLLAQQLQHL